MLKSKLFSLMDAQSRFFLGALSLAGVVLILLMTSRYGAGVTTDSTGYIAVARNLLAGRGAVDASGDPFTIQPPCFPAALAAAGWLFRQDPAVAARWVNALIFGLICFQAGLLLFRHTASRAYVFAGVGTLLITRSLAAVSIMAWSEPLFVLLLMLFLGALESYLAERRMKTLLLLSVATALAVLTRYVGVTLIATGLLCIAILGQSRLKRRLLDLLVFASISLAPFILWLLRNHALAGSFFGPRAPTRFTLPVTLNAALRVFFCWILPERLLDHVLALPSLITAVTLFFGTILLLMVRFCSREEWLKLKSAAVPVAPQILFVAIYTAFLVRTSVTTAFDLIDNRLLAPAYVPAVVVAFTLARSLAELLKRRFPQARIGRFLAAAAMVLLLPSLAILARNARLCLHEGVDGYNHDLWQRSETIGYLRSHSLDQGCPIFSNAPDALYFLASLPARMSPAKTSYNSHMVVGRLSTMRHVWPEEPKAYLVWFDKMNRDRLFTISQLRAVTNMREYLRFSDGIIFMLAKKN